MHVWTLLGVHHVLGLVALLLVQSVVRLLAPQWITCHDENAVVKEVESGLFDGSTDVLELLHGALDRVLREYLELLVLKLLDGVGDAWDVGLTLGDLFAHGQRDAQDHAGLGLEVEGGADLLLVQLVDQLERREVEPRQPFGIEVLGRQLAEQKRAD